MATPATSDDDGNQNVVKLPSTTSFKSLRPEWGPLLGCVDDRNPRIILDNQAAAHAVKLESELKGRIKHLKDVDLPAKQTEHDRLATGLKELPEFIETTRRRMTWPRGWLSRSEVLAFGGVGLAILGIGWQNSSQLILEHIQDTVASYCLTAPLLLLPLTTHVANKTLNISPRWITAVLGLIGITGGCLLVSTLVAGGAPVPDAGTDWTKLLATPLDKGRLLLAQALLECSLGTVLIYHVEHLLTSELPARISNPSVISAREKLGSAIERIGTITDEISSHEGTLDQLQKAQTAWVETQMATWRDLR